MERTKAPVLMTYRAVGSSTGQLEFVGEANNGEAYNNFGAGDIPMKKDYYDALVLEGRKMVHFPFVMGGISFFHSVPDSETGGELDLTGCLLAKIFSGEITKWDDPEIKAKNPDLQVPGSCCEDDVTVTFLKKNYICVYKCAYL